MIYHTQAYHAQVLALKKVLKGMKKVRVGTVEEFQGEEKMIIIFSAVKTSGMEKALQFIFCKKRLNTAVSRARLVLEIHVIDFFGNTIQYKMFKHLNIISVCWWQFSERHHCSVLIRIGMT